MRLGLDVHHLVVDGVSWRILLDDLQSALRETAAGRTAAAVPIGTSYRRWAQLLGEEAARPSRAMEVGRWASALAEPLPRLSESTLDPALDIVAGAGQFEQVLPGDVTVALLEARAGMLHAETGDVLVAAYVAAVASWCGLRGRSQDVLLRVEGHGREDLFPGVDLSGTVGWFTTEWPARFAVADLDLDAVLRGVPEAVPKLVDSVTSVLRSAPNRGIGYGLLRYLAGVDELSGLGEPEIGFNFLGRADASPKPGRLAIAGRPGSGHADPEMPLHHVLELNAIVEDRAGGPRLVARWTWASRLLDDADLTLLRDTFSRAVAALAAYGGSAGVRTPDEDLFHLDLDQADIDALGAEIFADLDHDS